MPPILPQRRRRLSLGGHRRVQPGGKLGCVRNSSNGSHNAGHELDLVRRFRRPGRREQSRRHIVLLVSIHAQITNWHGEGKTPSLIDIGLPALWGEAGEFRMTLERSSRAFPVLIRGADLKEMERLGQRYRNPRSAALDVIANMPRFGLEEWLEPTLAAFNARLEFDDGSLTKDQALAVIADDEKNFSALEEAAEGREVLAREHTTPTVRPLRGGYDVLVRSRTEIVSASAIVERALRDQMLRGATIARSVRDDGASSFAPAKANVRCRMRELPWTKRPRRSL